jgi:outer membrane murein-binding lipoprotein Lpp
VSDDQSDIRWVSYSELSDIRGISKASAFRMANRRKWERRKGNDGTVRVAVPVSALERQSDARSDDRSDALSGRISELEAEIAALREQIGGLREERAAALARADELRAVVDRLTAWPGAGAWARLRRVWRAR